MAAKLQFIFGLAGSGKTEELTRRLLAALRGGRRCFLIVPEQNVVTAETKLAQLTEGSDSSGLVIASFTRLCNLIFRQLGGLAYNYADAGARTVTMWRTLDELTGLLKEYKITPENSRRWAQLMLTETARLKTRGITPAMLEGASLRLPESYTRLKNKLSDLSLIGVSYSRLLAELYDDPSDDLTRAAARLTGSGFFAGCDVFFDAFDGFTQPQYILIREMLRQAGNATVALCSLPGMRSPAFDTVARTERILRRIAGDIGAEVQNPFVLRIFPRYKNVALERVAAFLWDEEDDITGANIDRPVSADNGRQNADPATHCHIRVVDCTDRYEEAELAASEIARYVHGGGRWRDCAVIARNMTDYDGIIDAALERVDAPYFMSTRIDVSTRPVVKFVLSALAVVAGGWRSQDVISMLKTGMAGITPDECDSVEEYLSTWRINGARRWTAEYDWRMNPDGYTDTLTPRGERILATVNAIRAKIVPPLAALAESFTLDILSKTKGLTTDTACKADGLGNVKRASAAVYKLLCDFDIPGQLSEHEEELARQLWDALMNALDTVATVAGDATVTAEQYSQLLAAVLRQATVGRIPASVDEVTVGQSDRLRAGEIKLCILLGASEGIFPGKTDAGDEIFKSSELEILREFGLDPCDNAELLASAELFGFYRAATTPSERLVVTFTGTAGGFDGKERPVKPSQGVERLIAMFPELIIEKYSDIPHAEQVWSRESALEAAIERRDTPDGAALRELLCTDLSFAAFITAAENPFDSRNERLSPELAAEIFRGDLSLTQSRLDSYVMCAFGFYCKYMLDLCEPAVAEFDSADTGNFTHRILERFMRAVMNEDGKINFDLTKKQRAELADTIISEYIEGAFGQSEERSPRTDSLFRRLRRTTLLVIENLIGEFSQSEFTPRYFELPIARGGAAEPLRIPLPDGGSAYIYGKIDRVDTYKRGGDVFLRVVDYKTGTKKFSVSDLALGLNMQLLLYLFSLWHGGNKSNSIFKEDENILPAGMLYMSAGAQRVDAEPDENEEAVAARASDGLERTGILINDEELLRAMEKKLEKKYIPVWLKKDGALGSTLSLEDIAGFGKLMKNAEKTIAEIGGRMKHGEASAQPLCDNKRNACEFCSYGAVCRVRKI